MLKIKQNYQQRKVMKNYLTFHNDFKGFQLHTPKVKMKMHITISMCKLKIDITDIIQVLKNLDVQRDFWIACEHGGVQMDASTDGLVVPHRYC